MPKHELDVQLVVTQPCDMLPIWQLRNSYFKGELSPDFLTRWQYGYDPLGKLINNSKLFEMGNLRLSQQFSFIPMTRCPKNNAKTDVDQVIFDPSLKLSWEGKKGCFEQVLINNKKFSDCNFNLHNNEITWNVPPVIVDRDFVISQSPFLETCGLKEERCHGIKVFSETLSFTLSKDYFSDLPNLVEFCVRRYSVDFWKEYSQILRSEYYSLF